MEVSVPQDESIRDHDALITRSLAVIAAHERRSQSDVLRDLRFYVEDVVVMIESGTDTEDGTISFARGEEVFLGAKQSLHSLAHMEITPHSHLPRLRRKDPDTFIKGCRWAQTAKGSYIMSVICPLGAVPMKPNPANPPIPELGFTRSVTTRLADTLEQVVQCADSGDIETAIGADDTRRLSVNLCDGLLLLTPSHPGSSLTINVQWAKSQPVEREGERPASSTLQHKHRTFIEEVRSYLQTDTSDPEVVRSFFGRIESLAGDLDEEHHRQGLVFFRVTDADGQRYRVRVNLSPQDHKKAHGVYLDADVEVMFRGILRGTGSLRSVDNYSDFAVRRTSN